MDLAAILAWAAARAPVGWRGFFGRSGAAATLGSGVSSAASSAVVGVRFGAPARDRLRSLRGVRMRTRALRVELASPVRLGAPSSMPKYAVLRTAAKGWLLWTTNRTPLLRFWSPAALACHVALLPGGATSPAIPLRPLACVTASFALMLLEHAAPTHRRRLLVPAVLRFGGVGAIDSARIEAARFDRDAPPVRRVAAFVSRRSPAGHAPATFCIRRSATR